MNDLRPFQFVWSLISLVLIGGLDGVKCWLDVFSSGVRGELCGECCGHRLGMGIGVVGWVHTVRGERVGVDVVGSVLGVPDSSRRAFSSLTARCCSDGSL